ncbi:MAG: low specificity L-threonine aldolase [Chthoniobacterales bacterium]
MTPHRYDLASDNTAPICPEAWQALAEANVDAAASYGEDKWTARVSGLAREIFETDCEVFFVFNGTAANGLALAQLGRSFHSVVCHEHSHISTDECGAPEFLSGGSKLLPTAGAEGKLDLAAIADTLAKQRELHSPKPRVLSVTQATELGTVYTREELAAIADFARAHALRLHMDGARFANAVATLGCSPKSITWELGVDVLCLGGTKNGTGGGELVIFFDRDLAQEFDYRAKQAGQLASKMRMLAAPWAGLLENGVWLRNAQRANAAAGRLEQALAGISGLKLAFPRQANALFLHMPESLVKSLSERGWHFYKFIEPDIYRLMCSFAARDEVIDAFAADAKDCL